MRKTLNKEHIEGRVYEHDLAVKTVQSQTKADGTPNENYGKEYIGGSLSVATDDECLNVVKVVFTYVTAMTKKGTKNETFTALKNIIETGKTVLVDGAENATMVKIDTALGLNDFYTNRNGEEVLVQAKRNEGGFVHIANKLGDERNKFEFDIVINKTVYVEADEEKHIDQDYLLVKGAIFNFRNALLPVDLVVKNPGGMKYFESLDASDKNPIFTKVWGTINSTTIIDKREEESAFGEPAIKEFSREIKEWVITGTAKEPYEFGDAERGITEEELKQAIADRQTHLADVKKNAEEYAASRQANGGGTPVKAATTAAAGAFNF